MITLEEFLYLENVKESQARLILKEYGGIKFTTPDEFRKFFQNHQVVLELETIDDRTEKQQLLDRFKGFKNSSEYGLVKKYIQDQIKLQKEIQKIQNEPNTSVEVVTNLLNGITTEPVDPFFNFVIRKILTGTDTGVLPSERLSEILSNLIKAQTTESYDEVSDVERDGFDRLINYENLYKNKGRIRVPVLDERFLLQDFRYIVDTSFDGLNDAVFAEANVLEKLDEALSSDIAAGGATSETDRFLSSLGNLVNENANSITGLNAKIKSLNEVIASKNDFINSQFDAIDKVDESIKALALQNTYKNIEIDAKDETITELNIQIDTTISNLEEKVTKQLENTNAAFDNLTKKLEEQAKKAEENAARQLQAFESAVSGLAKAVTPPTPTPAPTDSPEEKRRKEKISAILSRWDNIKYINANNDDQLVQIMDKVGVSTLGLRSKFTDLNGTLSSRAEQVYNWNTIYKQQFKSNINVNTVKTEKDADFILGILPQLETSKSAETTVRNFLYDNPTSSTNDCTGDILDKWRKDCLRGRGVNGPMVSEIAGIVGARYVEWDTVDVENKLKIASFDTIIEVLGIVNKFPVKY